MAVAYRLQDNAYFRAASGSGTLADPFVPSGTTGSTASPTATGANAQVTGLSSAQQLSPPSGALFASVQVLGAVVAVTFDGTTPSSSNGQQFSPGDILNLSAAEAAAAKFIQLAASATLQVYYSK